MDPDGPGYRWIHGCKSQNVTLPLISKVCVICSVYWVQNSHLHPCKPRWHIGKSPFSNKKYIFIHGWIFQPVILSLTGGVRVQPSWFSTLDCTTWEWWHVKPGAPQRTKIPNSDLRVEAMMIVGTSAKRIGLWDPNGHKWPFIGHFGHLLSHFWRDNNYHPSQ